MVSNEQGVNSLSRTISCMGAPRRPTVGVFLATMALSCAAPAFDEEIGDIPEWTLRRGLAIGSPDDPVYGLWAVGGVLVDQEHVYVVLAREGTIFLPSPT